MPVVESRGGRYVCVRDCNDLTHLPQNFGDQYRRCSRLFLENLRALTELQTFPEHLLRLRIMACPSLIFVCANELLQESWYIDPSHYLIRSITRSIEKILDHELKSFEQTGSLENFPKELQIIQTAHDLPVDQRVARAEEIGEAWWSCNKQRMRYIYSGLLPANNLILPRRLRILELRCCCISNGALSDCLGRLPDLEELHLQCIMTITTLPPEPILQSLVRLRVLKITDCWYLGSLGSLHALSDLEKLQIDGCYSLKKLSDASLPPSLQSIIIRRCRFWDSILIGHLPRLQKIVLVDYYGEDSVYLFSGLTSLRTLFLFNCPYLDVEIERPMTFIDTLAMVQTCFYFNRIHFESCWRGFHRDLQISISRVLNTLLLFFGEFVPPPTLKITYCQEKTITFRRSNHLQSITNLIFTKCKTKFLPTSLSEFSNLRIIIFKKCEEISELPVLPASVQTIWISGCPVLRERCQLNGPDWHKIQHIPNRCIE